MFPIGVPTAPQGSKSASSCSLFPISYGFRVLCHGRNCGGKVRCEALNDFCLVESETVRKTRAESGAQLVSEPCILLILDGARYQPCRFKFCGISL